MLSKFFYFFASPTTSGRYPRPIHTIYCSSGFRVQQKLRALQNESFSEETQVSRAANRTLLLENPCLRSS
jgi:hypothetical protein